jgi:hypothetical protein
MRPTDSNSQVVLRSAAHDEPMAPETPTSLENREEGYLDGLPLVLVILGLMLCIFLASLDQFILSTRPLCARPIIIVADLMFQSNCDA